jgi:CheY-like chemotaxis protein
MALVLIVEDDSDVCKMLDLFLRSEGFTTVCASNGEEALTRMREQCPCVVLLDVHMPIMDGFEFRRQQLADSSLAAVPVVCITGHYDPESIEQALKLRCVPKPIRFPDILSQVSALCR